MFSIAEGASAAFLAATFMWAAVSKANRPAQWRQDLDMFPLPRLVRGLSFMVLPWVELALAAALALGQTWAAIPLLALSLFLPSTAGCKLGTANGRIAIDRKKQTETKTTITPPMPSCVL